MTLGRHAALLQALDLVEIDWPTWRPGPSARTLLPRATALADLWAPPEQAGGPAAPRPPGT